MKLLALSLIALSSITFHAWAGDIDDLSDKVDELNSQLEDVNSKLDDANDKLDELNGVTYYTAPTPTPKPSYVLTPVEPVAAPPPFTMEDMKRWRGQWEKLGKWDLVAKADVWIADHVCW